MRESLRREVTRLAGLLALAGCTAAPKDSGSVPENATRDAPHGEPVGAMERIDAYNRRDSAPDGGVRTLVATVDPAAARIGVAAAREFHRPECPALEDVPAAEQVRFTSKWDGLDGGYRPCERCRAMQ